MSSKYNMEPPTDGMVILTTSLGEIEIELWSKEAPLAVRNFCQLCMEQYFDGVIFHRVIKDFMAQTGDPTGRGDGGESIYDGKPFKDEFCQRIRFNHPGLVAMASSVESAKNSNQSQFFFNLSACEWLNNKHTIFGRITSKTIYNALKFNEIEVGENDRPIAPEPRILSTKVITCPFDDIVPRESRHAKLAAEDAEKKRKLEKKAKKERKHLEKKNMRLVSFEDNEEPEPQPKAAMVPVAKPVDTIAVKKQEPMDSTESQLEKMKAEYKAMKQSRAQSSKTEAAPKKDTMSELEKRRLKYQSKKDAGKDRQSKTLELLSAFNNKLVSAQKTNPSTESESDVVSKNPKGAYKGGIGSNIMEDEGWRDANDKSWMTAKLKSRKHIDDQFRKNEVAESDLTVIDSRTKRGRDEFDELYNNKKRPTE